MMRTKTLFQAALMVGALSPALLGCAAQMQQRGDVVLERSADRAPEWASKDTFERDGSFYVVSEGTDGEGYALARRIAKAVAAQSVAEAVSLKIKSELTQSTQRLGMAPSGGFVQDTVAMASQLVTVQDFVQEADYREKVARAEDGATRYRVAALFKLPVAQLKAAKLRALQAMQAKAVQSQDVKAEADARRLLDEVKGQ